MKSLVSITRSRHELTVTTLCVELPDAALLETLEKAELLDFGARYSLQTCALNACDVAFNERRQQLERSWRALESVAAPNVETLFHVCVALLETVVGTEENPDLLPLLTWHRETVAPTRKPTAAHPRAYKGTKVQPPKLPLPETVDLRPYLRGHHSLRLVLTRLRPFWNEAALRLQRFGYEPGCLKALGMAAQAGNDADSAINAILAAEGEASRLPAKFRRVLLPLLQGSERAQVTAYLALYWKLQLDADEPLLSAFAHLVQQQNDDRTLAWGEVLARLTTDWRVPFACLLACTQAYRLDPRALSPAVLKAFETIEAQPYPVYRLYCLLLGLARKVDGDYLLAGFAVANETYPKHRFYDVERSGPYPVEAAQLCVAHIRPTFSGRYEDTPLLIWEACGALPGFDRMLAATSWSAYSPDVAREYVRLFLSILWQDGTIAQKTDCWLWLRQIKPRLDLLLEHTQEEYRSKCLSILNECAWEWGETPQTRKRLTNALALIERVCRPPLRQHSGTAYAMAILARHLEDAACMDIVFAPDSSFLRLEEACARENSATLVEAGMETLARHTADWMAQAFARYAAKLCRIARLLGCFSDAMRAKVARDYARWLCSQPNVTPMELTEACAFAEASGIACGQNFVPRALREHLAQTRLLIPERLAHYRREMEDRLLLAQLETLEQNALQAMCSGFEDAVDLEAPSEGGNAAVHHAMQMRCHITDNRRGFRKFLRAYLSGDKHYLRQHPRSQAWFRRHPRVTPEIWLQGIKLPAVCIEGIGTVHIGVETEPLEALRMGTHVGSCLGIGGAFAHSAVANMLDINKQVVYARNEAGRVVARQLIVVSEEEQLVCYGVYPDASSRALQGLFRDYDRQWASALGLELFRAEGDAEYTIAHVLSQRWWADYAWNLEIDNLSA